MKDKIYEVIRVIGGKPVFMAEHYDRYVNSLACVGREPALTRAAFENEIRQTIASENIHDQNIRMEQFVDPSDGNEHVRTFPIESHYPTEEMFAEGVKVALFKAERDKPRAKISNDELRALTNEAIRVTGTAEVLLVNRNGEITEGSRSNVFFVRDGRVFAAPQDTVLPGITRLKVLELMKDHGIAYEETSIRADDIGSFDAAFLTGTSKEVLPIVEIENFRYDVNDPVIRSLLKWYREIETR